MQLEFHNGHHHERTEDGEDQAGADDHSHAPSHGQGQNDQHDGDRLGQVDHEIVDRLGNQVRLPGYLVYIDA